MQTIRVTTNTVGQIHNELLQRYYQENPRAVIRRATPAAVQNAARTLAFYLTDFGYQESEIEAALQKVRPELTRKDIYASGVLRPVDELIPILAEDVLVRARAGNDFAQAVRQAYTGALQADVSRSSLKEAVNASSLTNPTWSASEQDLADIFVSVTNASHELWTADAQMQQSLTRQEKVIIADAVGAIVGGLGGLIGAIVVGAVTSLVIRDVVQ